MLKASQLKTLSVVVLASIIVAACQASSGGLKTEPVSAPMPAFSVKANSVGYTRTTKNHKGETATSELVSIEGDLYNFESSTGATWTNYANPILPSPKWSGEDWGVGTQSIEEVEGALFPLEVGNTMSFYVVGKSTKWPDGWKDKRDCEVKAQERISVEAGDFDAFKVVCNDEWRARTYYFSPEVNDIVWYRSVHKKNPDRNTGWELSSLPST
jgi:hypothetical protein